MKILHFSYIDYIVFAIMFGFTCIAGISMRSFKRSTGSDFFTNEGKTRILPVALCLVASTLSGVSLLGLPSEVYMHGTQISMIALSIIIMGVVNNYIYLPVFYSLELKNPVDYLEIRFDKKIKKVATIFNNIGVTLSLPLIIYVPSLALTQVSGFDLNIISSLMFLICISYATIVRMRTVEWISAFQLTITIIALGIVLLMGIISVGGVSNVWEKSEEGNRLEFFNMDPNPLLRCTFWSVVLGNSFSWLGFVAVNSSGVQRFISLQSLTDAKKVLVIFVILASVSKLISCFSGLILYTKYFDCDPLSMGYMKKAGEILPFYVLEVASKCPGLSGLFIAGLFSTALNTMSTSLNVIATDMYENIVAPLIAEEVSEGTVNQVTTSFIILIAMLSAGSVLLIERLGSLLELFQCAYGITGGPVLGMFTLGMLFPIANRKGALCGGVVSAVIMALIIVYHQIEIWNGTILYDSKGMHTYGCDINTFLYDKNDTAEVSLNGVLQKAQSTSSSEIFSPSKISFHYYYLIGTIITVAIGLIVSWITRRKGDEMTNHNVFSPCIQRFLNPIYTPI